MPCRFLLGCLLCYAIVIDGRIRDRRVGITPLSQLRKLLDQSVSQKPNRLEIGLPSTVTPSDTARPCRSISHVRLAAAQTQEFTQSKSQRWFTINRAEYHEFSNTKF